MAESEQDRIRKRAYAIWEEEGRPWGRDSEHWERANRELAAASIRPLETASEQSEAERRANGLDPETMDAPQITESQKDEARPAKATVRRRKAKSTE